MTLSFGRVVNLEDCSFFIHGLIHDNPLVSIQDSFKKSIGDLFQGHPTVCEDGFIDWIKGSRSFGEIEYFGLNRLTYRDCLTFLKGYVYNRFIRKIHKEPFMKRVQEVTTLEDFETVREILFKSYPTEPEGMNMLMARMGSGTIESPKGELPLRVRRYVYEAKESLRYAKDNGLRELHIVVGCAHELPLEYLLKNQEILYGLSA